MRVHLVSTKRTRTLHAASLTMAEVLWAQRGPDGEAPVQRPARAWARGQQGVRWDLVSTVPMRVAPGAAPRWQGEEGEEESRRLLPPPLRPCPFAELRLRRARGV